MHVIDVSLSIEEDIVCYPGNPEPVIEKYRQIPEDSTTESEIDIGSHTGTHVDAPQHIQENGETVKDLDLEQFYGEAQVLNLTSCREKVDIEDLREKNIDADIVLLKTDNSNHQYQDFREDFTYLTLEGVEYLVQEGVKTVGIDYLSLVKFNGGEDATKAHEKANKEMNVIEGLDLRNVEPDTYIFSGMPIKIDTDGAPMRAVLITK
ncbi:MAG: putative metal-dependent hydrolase [Candidatus Nanosalina sp. J07AB43]|nr:MAG: putative metal-dependent hydrolase [Candidatus Nanosalina sp. J07AB43]